MKKFRVWLKDHYVREDMIDQVRLGWDGKVYWCHAEGVEDISDVACVEWQTGLKDKNGNDIFDGDIIKLAYGIPPTYDILKIEYADDEYVNDCSVSGWWMRSTRKGGCSSSLCKTYENDIEIIGNIHDNPELLEAKE